MQASSSNYPNNKAVEREIEQAACPSSNFNPEPTDKAVRRTAAFANMYFRKRKNVENDVFSRLEMGLAEVYPPASNAIYKVQRRLRDVYKEAYEPELVTIGPYHHGKAECKDMEGVKLLYMKSLLFRKTEVTLEDYTSKIEKIEKKARRCYAEAINNIGTQDFIDMLVLDGCFIIELISSEGILHNAHLFHSLEYDLVLLENQIPFFVLCELFDLIEGPNQHYKLMKRVLTFCKSVFPGNILYKPKKKPKEVNHILDLIHTNWCPFPPHNITIDDTEIEFSIPTVDLEFSIPNVARMKDANVKFEKKAYHRDPDPDVFHETRGTTLFDVEFNEKKGIMLMPTLVIKDNTERLLRNLIAYEQNYSIEPAHVTDYAMLLDGLINSSKDHVQILTQVGIIQNWLGSHQEVVDVVNRLTCKIIYFDELSIYADMFRHIRTYRKNSWRRAMLEYHRHYFSSTWSYISLFAGILLFLLTITQTVFAALQQFS